MGTQNMTLSLLIRIMETCQSTFGGIMALHLSIYTIDILSETFSCMILGLRGDYWTLLIAMFYLVGRFVRVYNIVSMCDWLSNAILIYSDHLEIVGVDIPDDSRERKVCKTSVRYIINSIYLYSIFLLLYLLQYSKLI